MAKEVDVAILGAGGAGYPAAFFLDRAGKRVVMADPIGNLGGDCLAEGCVPSKAVREASLIRSTARRYRVFGLNGAVPNTDWNGVLAHKDRVQRIRYAQHSAEIRDSGVIFHAGVGRVVSESEVEIDDHAGVQRYQFQRLILATGSRPHRLPIPGAELAITSHDLFRFGADLPFPQELVVVGGGYIGVETASMFENFGSRVTVLEFTDQLLPGFDPEIAAFLKKALEARVRIELEAEVLGIEKSTSGVRVRYRQGGVERDVSGNVALMATGREVVLPDGVQALGLKPAKAPPVNDRLQTENARVYAPGDVNGRSMLFHSAVRQSLVAARCILAADQAVDRMDFESVPHTVFSEPEVATVGLTEAQARERCAGVEAVRYSYKVDSRAQIFDQTEGFIKMIFEKGTSCLLGAQVAGLDAVHLIAPLTLAVNRRLTAGELTEVVFPHPMISEGINKAVRAFRP
jgi:dihydrolipoamide dehydrogenase